MLWRQGDIYIEKIQAIPTTARARLDGVLAEGEITGHLHKIENLNQAWLMADGEQLYVDVRGPEARIVHDEHDEIVLSCGKYRVWRQREFDPLARAPRLVID